MQNVKRFTIAGVLAGLFLCSLQTGCGGGVPGTPQYLLGTPLFTTTTGSTGDTDTGGTGTSSFFGAGSRANVDPCSETTPRKFITISMANLSDDFVHYFFAMIAFVNTEDRAGAVCADDINLYTSFGYTLVDEGQSVPFGNYCIEGPALIYFHENGQFQGGGNSLASAIAPASGTQPSYDSFFTAAGAQVPVPDLILFHNPGSGDGQNLLASFLDPDPCGTDGTIAVVDPECQLDSFYYVDETDRLAAGGTSLLGIGAGRRVPNEIQGTGCECGAVDTAFGLGTQNPFQNLAPSNTNASGALCNEFLRGGSITYVFIRDDVEPPVPQLLWRVLDAAGSEVHNFDPSAGISGI